MMLVNSLELVFSTAWNRRPARALRHRLRSPRSPKEASPSRQRSLSSEPVAGGVTYQLMSGESGYSAKDVRRTAMNLDNAMRVMTPILSTSQESNGPRHLEVIEYST